MPWKPLLTGEKPLARPKGSKSKTDDAKTFVANVERMLRAEGSSQSLERLACRWMTDKKNPQTGFGVWRTLIAYKHGQPKESTESIHKVQIELKVEDADAIIARYFVSSGLGADRIGEGDPGQTSQQDHKLLPQ